MNDINAHYKLLGIEPGTPEEEIKEAYRDLVMVWHPDKYENNPRLRLKAEEKLKEINNAYSTIISSLKDFNRSTESQKARKSHSYQQSRKPRNEQSIIVSEMVYIHGGEFMMGDNGSAGEKPVHKVKVDAFYIGKYVVTRREWRTFMGGSPSKFIGDDLPVEDVSWNDTQEYLKKLSNQTGKCWRLPTEAEWEYACRAGSTATYCFGNDELKLCEYAWYKANSDGKAHPVGQKKPNAWGLYDMHGNVYEWCQDWYDGNYYANSPINNPKGPSSGIGRVFRGGNYDETAELSGILLSCLRSARRFCHHPLYNYSNKGMGFRCVQDP